MGFVVHAPFLFFYRLFVESAMAISEGGAIASSLFIHPLSP